MIINGTCYYDYTLVKHFVSWLAGASLDGHYVR
jgi:hypothetical protein